MFGRTFGFENSTLQYLDGAKIAQLCVYLECLHDAGRENSHHTSILLNAYARQGQKKKMIEFIERLTASRKQFDMRPIFNILCECKFLPEASLLATKLGMHDEALATIIDHMHRYSMAVKLIAKRPTEEAIRHLEKYGRILLEKCRDETMSLLLDCIARSSEDKLDIKRLVDIFIGDSDSGEAFIEYAVQKSTGQVKEELVNMLLEIRLRACSNDKQLAKRADELIMPLISKSNEQHALNLAQTFDCQPVIEFVLKSSHRNKELLTYYMKNNNLKAITALCQEINKPQTWIDALSFVAKSEQVEDEALVLILLDALEKCQAVHPLVVLDVLSKSNTLTISAVKSYVINWLTKQENKMDEDRKRVQENEKRMKELDSQIESLKFK
ncbi:unnamed protein product [Caenorhabditis auriculariae]|uniref:Uncharacterized protein n=1 Tax=Caenorhabditis auriculariae TaxID=2777116 RepID=A0A8S1HXQ9_9PELO|nr:unnamed protein product [Caenorhabditis auriculariae]